MKESVWEALNETKWERAGAKGYLSFLVYKLIFQICICIKFINFKSTKTLRYKSPTLTLMAYGFYWGRQCSWTLTTANSMQVSNMQSDFEDITISIKMHIKGSGTYYTKGPGF